jgi:hypothetical protein
VVNFKLWFEASVQQLFPFMTDEEPLDWKKIGRFKNRDSYIKSKIKGSRNTENAAKEVISAPVGLWGEELTNLWNDAVVVKTQRGTEIRLAFANFTSKIRL